MQKFLSLCGVLCLCWLTGIAASELSIAILAGDVATVKALLEEDPSCVNKPDMEVLRMTPIQLIVGEHAVEIAALLIANGADVNLNPNGAGTPLCIANSQEASQAVELARLYLDHGAQVDTPDRFGDTPLHQATRAANSALTTLYIDRGAKINQPNHAGETPLHYATVAGNPAFITMLLERGANLEARTKRGGTLLHVAASHNNVPVMTFLLKEKGFRVDCTDDGQGTPLFYALSFGHEEATRFLLEQGASVTYRSVRAVTPLHIAAAHGNLANITVLLARGAQADVATDQGVTPLHLTCSLAVAQALIAGGADVNARNKLGRTPIYTAILPTEQGRQFPELVAYYLKQGAEVNVVDTQGVTPLLLAVQHKDDSIVEQLISSGARVDVLLPNGSTALHLARSGAIATHLLQLGIDPCLRDAQGCTALHRAAQRWHREVMISLLTTNATASLLNAQDNAGNTALHYVAKTLDNVPVLSILLEAGADVHVKTHDGKTALDLAVARNNTEMATLLQTAMQQ